MGRRWWGANLEALRLDYENPERPLKRIIIKHRTSLGQVARLAKRHGWMPRRPKAKSPKMAALQQRKRYLSIKIGEMTEELRRLDSKITFLETINGGNRESTTKPG